MAASRLIGLDGGNTINLTSIISSWCFSFISCVCLADLSKVEWSDCVCVLRTLAVKKEKFHLLVQLNEDAGSKGHNQVAVLIAKKVTGTFFSFLFCVCRYEPALEDKCGVMEWHMAAVKSPPGLQGSDTATGKPVLSAWSAGCVSLSDPVDGCHAHHCRSHAPSLDAI